MGASPFSVSPATVFARPTADDVWLGPTQRAALSRLSSGPTLRVLTGEAATGKSVLLNRAASGPGEVVRLECSGPRRGSGDVLAALLASADLPALGLDEIDQRNLLGVFVQHRRSQGQRVVVIVDDAHLLAPDAWCELDRLRAIKFDGAPAVELLCAGRTPSEAHIESFCGSEPDEPALLRLEPPSPGDVASYLTWRLRRFGLEDLFTALAIQLVARLGGGSFRAIDVLCQMAMLIGKELGVARIDAQTVRHALRALSERHAERVSGDGGQEASMPEAQLVVSRDGHELRRIRLGSRTMIGRSEHNDVALPSPFLSRHHATIVGTPAGYYVVDLNSANGLEINGRRATRAVLADLDVITIGPYRLKMRMSGTPALGDPLPPPGSLETTGQMPKPPPPAPAIRRIK
ncbi:MAG TPA: FHA domain-containing protein [Gammaproteobacteria bacterium]|nr:FHA domain-containing protein [Gammaproteobacteria bacterium]